MLGFKASGDEKDSQNRVIATYEGGKVHIKDATFELNRLISKNEKLKGLTFDKLNAQQQEILIKEIVLTKIAVKEAKKRKLDRDQDYQEALQNFETELLKQKFLVALAKEVTDEKNLKKNYDELVEELKNKKDLRISYIALENQKQAEAVYKIVSKSPKSFAAQARKKSIDKEIAKKGGDLGFVIEDALPDDVLAQVKRLQKGQISEPFTTNDNWVVIKFDDERPAQIAPFDKAKEALTQNLVKKAMQDFATQGLEKAQIKMLVN